jgi:hypothetical protein
MSEYGYKDELKPLFLEIYSVPYMRKRLWLRIGFR